MKRILSLALALALVLTLPGCGTAAADYTVLTADPVAITYDGSTEPAQTALAGFGLDLLRGTRDQTEKPALVSPLSAALALSMAANGAGGEHPGTVRGRPVRRGRAGYAQCPVPGADRRL